MKSHSSKTATARNIIDDLRFTTLLAGAKYTSTDGTSSKHDMVAGIRTVVAPLLGGSDVADWQKMWMAFPI